jgi:hypothetical protein
VSCGKKRAPAFIKTDVFSETQSMISIERIMRWRPQDSAPQVCVERDKPRAFSSEVDARSREENASKQKPRAPFRFCRNGKGSRSRLEFRSVSPTCHGPNSHDRFLDLSPPRQDLSRYVDLGMAATSDANARRRSNRRGSPLWRTCIDQCSPSRLRATASEGNDVQAGNGTLTTPIRVVGKSIRGDAMGRTGTIALSQASRAYRKSGPTFPGTCFNGRFAVCQSPARPPNPRVWTAAVCSNLRIV